MIQGQLPTLAGTSKKKKHPTNGFENKDEIDSDYYKSIYRNNS